MTSTLWVIVSGSKSVNHNDKSLCVPVVHISSGKVNLFDFLEAATIPNNEHLEILEGDTPTVKQIKSLTKEVSSLRNELKAKDQLIESLRVKDSVPMAGQNSALPWKDKVSSPEVHSRMKLQYFPPAVEGEAVRVSPPKHVETHGAEKWKDCIVGHFVDKKLPDLSVRSIAFRIWGKYGLKEVLSNGKGFFFFQFGAEGAYRQISEVGAWHFGNRLKVLQEWHPDLEFEKESLSKLPLWIQLSNVPLQYWPEEGLSYIASGIGKPLHADEMTESARRISYAKICVEVGVHSELPHSIDLTSAGRMLAKESVQPETFMRVPQAKVWAVKSVKTETEACAIPDIPGLQNSTKEPATTIPCANKFSALQEGVIIGTEWSYLEKRLLLLPMCMRGFFQHMIFCHMILVLGISDPDAVFQALTEMEQVSSKQAKVVYGSNHVPSQRQLWDDLRNCKGFVGSLPWIVVGDFNSILRPACGWENELNYAISFCKGNSFRALVFKLSLAAGVYFIWLERNSRVFGGNLKNPDRILAWRNIPKTVENQRSCDLWRISASLLGNTVPLGF
ncbi:hypothetical protein RHSIM_Rhsim12G0145000 [Rhododendron simsii]|uniref:DUF4283 domain-containing protein n=1 Tax=Rhododendron simsii TaxID=118357 RepID=A0A834G7C8_RHOSS|nr:hypothetical protein RHSIM_Rhsim12G0145000 [Rhododendron simsii]